MKKIGLYICKCGGTISDQSNFNEIIEAAKKIDGVSSVQVQDFYCTEEGKNIILNDLKTSKVDAVVTIACSSKLHSKTFNDVLLKAKVNPYLLHMVNIREQCTWMTKDKKAATEKIIRMMKAGVEKAKYLEALEQKEIEINTDVAVIGGGIAGIEASLLLAKQGRTIYLIEKEPGFGGILPKLEHTYPSMECAPCILAPRIKAVSDTSNIKMYHNSTVEKAMGFGGNFTITVNKRSTCVKPEACISCMACIEACPVDVPGKKKAIDFYFPGSVPKAPYINKNYCLRFKGGSCSKCKEACAFDAIDYDIKDEVAELKAGCVIIAVGAREFDIAKIFKGIKSRPDFDIYTGLDFEKILSAIGPTKGKIEKKNGKKPKSICIVHCVGSRNPNYLDYCSGICCKNALKHSHAIKEKHSDIEVTHIYDQLCLDGLEIQNLAYENRDLGVKFKRWRMSEKGVAGIDVEKTADGFGFVLGGIDSKGNEDFITADMLVLETGLEANPDMVQLGDLFNFSVEKGYPVPEHQKIASISSTSEGVYIIGTATGPKDLTSSINEAKAAVGEIFGKYIQGKKLSLEPMISCVDPEKCGGCRICQSLCPYHAISYNEEKNISEISEVLCKGCGTCVSACAVGAIKANNFTYEQLKNEIKGALSDD